MEEHKCDESRVAPLAEVIRGLLGESIGGGRRWSDDSSVTSESTASSEDRAADEEDDDGAPGAIEITKIDMVLEEAIANPALRMAVEEETDPGSAACSLVAWLHATSELLRGLCGLKACAAFYAEGKYADRSKTKIPEVAFVEEMFPGSRAPREGELSAHARRILRVNKDIPWDRIAKQGRKLYLIIDRVFTHVSPAVRVLFKPSGLLMGMDSEIGPDPWYLMMRVSSMLGYLFWGDIDPDLTWEDCFGAWKYSNGSKLFTATGNVSQTKFQDVIGCIEAASRNWREEGLDPGYATHLLVLRMLLARTHSEPTSKRALGCPSSDVCVAGLSTNHEREMASIAREAVMRTTSKETRELGKKLKRAKKLRQTFLDRVRKERGGRPLGHSEEDDKIRAQSLAFNEKIDRLEELYEEGKRSAGVRARVVESEISPSRLYFYPRDRVMRVLITKVDAMLREVYTHSQLVDSCRSVDASALLCSHLGGWDNYVTFRAILQDAIISKCITSRSKKLDTAFESCLMRLALGPGEFTSFYYDCKPGVTASYGAAARHWHMNDGVYENTRTLMKDGAYKVFAIRHMKPYELRAQLAALLLYAEVYNSMYPETVKHTSWFEQNVCMADALTADKIDELAEETRKREEDDLRRRYSPARIVQDHCGFHVVYAGDMVRCVDAIDAIASWLVLTHAESGGEIAGTYQRIENIVVDLCDVANEWYGKVANGKAALQIGGRELFSEDRSARHLEPPQYFADGFGNRHRSDGLPTWRTEADEVVPPTVCLALNCAQTGDGRRCDEAAEERINRAVEVCGAHGIGEEEATVNHAYCHEIGFRPKKRGGATHPSDPTAVGRPLTIITRRALINRCSKIREMFVHK